MKATKIKRLNTMFSTYGQGVQNEPQVQPWVLQKYYHNFQGQVKVSFPFYLQAVLSLSELEVESVRASANAESRGFPIAISRKRQKKTAF